MKLKGTFKIRLFQGSDWKEKEQKQEQDHSTTVSQSANNSTPSKTTTGGTSAAPSHSASSEGKEVHGKAVRFRKDDLLRDLTTPAGRNTTSTDVGAASRGSSSSIGRDGKIQSRSGSSKPPRSSRPLFEVK